MFSFRTLWVVLVFALAGVAEAQAAPVPAQADLVPDFERLGLAPRVQGGRDTCSLFAITALAEFECAGKTPPPHVPLSEEFLIWAAHEAAGHKGDQAMFYEAVRGLSAFGLCSEDLMRYERKADAARKPSAAALADAAARSGRWRVHWIRRWDLKRPLGDAEVLAIKAALAAGHPVACGLRWPIALAGHEVLDVPPPDKVHDGHSIAFAGYQDDPKQNGGGTFVFRNWLGPRWGNKGYGVMSYAYARACTNDALWLHFGPPNSEVPVERFEAEALPVLARGRCAAGPQDMSPWGRPMWSQGTQLFCRAEDGGFVELGFGVRKAGRYRVGVQATAAPDYGIVRAALDGKSAGRDFDLYSGRLSPSDALELGTFDLAAGRHTLRFTVVGKNPVSAGFLFGLDTVDLLAAP
jgi:hypothetical protein